MLSNLSETSPHKLRLSELAATMLWSKSRLSHHITRMQHRGLVDREESPGDARGSIIVLTPAGLRTIQEAAPHHVESVRRNMIDLLTDEEIAALDALSHRVVAHLNAPRSQASFHE